MRKILTSAVLAAAITTGLSSPAEAAKSTSPPYSEGSRFSADFVPQGAVCRVAIYNPSDPAEGWVELWVTCKQRGETFGLRVWIDPAGNAILVGPWNGQ
jgi:hypothetical protein